MSDEEEESMSEGFSCSGDEWKPSKNERGGESSDDDDSDFEEVAISNNGQRTAATSKKNSKLSGVLKQQPMVKRRKPGAQSLRAKLYNKYRPPPKTITSPNSGQNSPSASTSKGKSKNYQTPNEANDSDTDGSVVNYLVNPDDIDFQSNFYNNVRLSEGNENTEIGDIKEPTFDCNAGIKNISDSDSEDNNDSSHEENERTGTNYNFQVLLENANSLKIMKSNLEKKVNKDGSVIDTTNAAIVDVNTLLALGEKQKHNHGDDKEEEMVSRLSKTKSTRIKRHTKTRPTSTVDAGDTDDSELEEVAGRKRF